MDHGVYLVDTVIRFLEDIWPKPSLSEAMAATRPQKPMRRKTVRHSCPVCGVEFEAAPQARYCSNKCRQVPKNAKRAAAIKAAKAAGLD